MQKRKHVLVTGGAGFIGSNIADDLLTQGYDVSVFDNFSTGIEENLPKAIKLYKGDTSQQNDLEKVFQNKFDVVFHIAGCASTINSFTNPLSDIYANFIGTVNIVNKCVENKIPRFIYASSMTVYGHPEKLPINEEHPTKPISYYGITKYAAERYVHATAERTDLPFSLNATTFRMFNVYGERQSLTNPYQGVMAIFIGNLLRGETVTIFGDGKQSRDFIYIKDVSKAWIDSIDNKKTFGNVYNLGFGQDISLHQLVETIAKIMGIEESSLKMIHKKARPGDQRHIRSDISKLKAALNWQPEYNLEDGLKRTIAWAKQTRA